MLTIHPYFQQHGAGQDSQSNALTPFHQLNSKQKAAVAPAYDLEGKIPAVRKAHDDLSEAFCALAVAHQEHHLQGRQAPPTVSLSCRLADQRLLAAEARLHRPTSS